MSKDYIEKHVRNQTSKFNIAFDIEEAQTSNILISGANRTGKSRLSAGICSILQNFKWKIVVFDNVGVWKEISDVPTFYTVREKRNYDPESKTWFYPFPKSSMLFNTSLLEPVLQKSFADKVTRDLWHYQIRKREKEWTLIALEESQLYMRNIRGLVAQNLLRICSAGRNHKLRVLGISVDLALLDPSFIRLCQQRYHAKLGIEGNAKRRFRDYYGLDW